MKYPAVPFTLTQFIEFHKLGVNPKDPMRTKILTAELRKRGFFQIHKDRQRMWTNDPDWMGFKSRKFREEIKEIFNDDSTE